MQTVNGPSTSALRCCLFLALLSAGLCLPPRAQAQILTAHYDITRQTPIAAFVYAQPVLDRVFVNGFIETWYNPSDYAFPENKWVLFSKHWISYSLTPRLSLSTEIEVSRNLAGAWTRWPENIAFKPNQWYVQPKVGFQLDLRKK